MNGYKSGSNYKEQGGKKWVVEGELVFQNGGTMVGGSDAAGEDLGKFYGETTGKYFRWNHAVDTLDVHGLQKFHAHLTTQSYGMQTRTEYNAATGDFFGVDMEAHQAISRTAGGFRALSMCARNVADSTLSGAASMVAGCFMLDNLGTFNGTGIHCAVIAKVNEGGTFTAVTHLTSLWVDSNQDGVVTGQHDLIYATNNGDSVMDQFIYLYGGNKINNLFELNTCGTMVGDKVDADIAFAHYKKIALTIDGVAYWLVAGTDA